MIPSSRHVPTNLDGRPFQPLVLTDDETCVVLSNTTRVALIKLLGAFSRDAYAERGLDEREATVLSRLYHNLHT